MGSHGPMATTTVVIGDIGDNSAYYDDSQDWYNQEWHLEVDCSQYQVAPEAEQQQVLLQLLDQGQGQLALGSLYEVGTDINIGRQSPQDLKEFWAIMIDTGAAVSVCPKTFRAHIDITPMPDRGDKETICDSHR
eukprot:3942557-Amphidinium_carterae.2